jgi:O-antigen biosynthesis protein
VRLLRAAVDSILAHTDYPHYEIVVIDNQSIEAETTDYFASLAAHPRVRVLKYDISFNYSALNNYGAAHCQSEIIAFVNNDIEAIHGEWLGEMVSHAIRPEVGAVGPMLHYPDGTVQSAGILVGVGVASNCATELPPAERPPRYELIQNYSAVTGACLLTRAALFREVGGFNEAELSVAYNDVDYCLKLRERGYLVTWTPYAELVHHESASRGSDKRGKQAARLRHEQRHLARRWPQALRHDPYYNPHLSRAADVFALSRDRECRPPWS